VANADLATALTTLAANLTAYGQCRNYYDGNHRLLFATDKFLSTFGNLFRAFACNLCPVVVDVPADRLTVTGFAVEGGQQKADDAWALWNANRMDRKSGQVHLEALTAGDAYAIVWPDKAGAPTIYPQRAAAVTVKYDDEEPGLITWAAKAWPRADKKVRVTLYYADRIEKYIATSAADGSLPTSANGLVPFETPGEPWPLPNPYGRVPVFHFGNNAGIGEFGASELANVIPLQDGLNKSICDRLVAQEFIAYPQRYATGLEVDKDPTTGAPIPPFIPGADRLWTVEDANVKFGEFAQARISEFIAGEVDWLHKIAAVSGIPLHYLVHEAGGWPSGESMKTAEARLIAKVKDRQLAFGNVWEDAMAFAMTIAHKPEARLVALWDDPTPRNEKDHASMLVMKRSVGISAHQVQREFGYSDEQIVQMEQENLTDPLAQLNNPSGQTDVPQVGYTGRVSGMVPS
jgi:Phage portal protein, SPP1 Gp6-like